jgi:uncharacterized protein (TIGR03435 family)
MLSRSLLVLVLTALSQLVSAQGAGVQPRAAAKPGFELVWARADRSPGPQLVASETDCEQEAARLASGGPVCMMLATRSFLNGDSRTMAQLATVLESYVKAPVADRTGLAGAFHMTVEWSKPGGAAVGPPESATPEEVSAMLGALQAQLGLKLQPAK